MDWLIDSALKDPSTRGNPVAMGKEDCRLLYETCI
jgi:alcohol dehydrogenase class IV